MSPRHLLHASCALSLLALTGVACDGNSNAAPETATPEAATAAQVEPASAQPPGPPPEPKKPLDGYVAHEWGLVRYHAQAPEVATSYFGRHLPTPTVATPKPKPPNSLNVRTGSRWSTTDWMPVSRKRLNELTCGLAILALNAFFASSSRGST